MTSLGRKVGAIVGRLRSSLRVQLVVAVLTLAAAPWTNVIADVFPDKPIRLILGFGTGGPTDVIARSLADQLSRELGQRAIVENKTGASGNIATQAVASADADGYTYLIGASPLAVNHSLFPDFPVKFGSDIVAVAAIGANANVLVVRPSLNVHTLAGPRATSLCAKGLVRKRNLAQCGCGSRCPG